MSFAALRNVKLVSNVSRNVQRGYGTTTKGPAREHALMPRGKIAAPKTDYRIFIGATVAVVAFGCVRYYSFHRRDEIKRKNYEQIVNSNMGPWRDFENRRMPKFAKVIANESPCGDSFKEAYLCALFEEGCDDKFGAFMTCLKENPVMMRDVKPDGNFNWESKLFLHNLLKERKGFEDLVASVGPAEENMEDVYDSYRARELLGANASESEVNAFKEKFAALRDEFYAEVQALFDGEKTDSSKADALLRKLLKEYSVPAAVWLQCMKDYDLEEFDEAVTASRRRFGTLLYNIKRQYKTKEARDVDLSKVSCGDQFDKMYQCIDNKDDSNDCLDFMDELYFCKLHHYKEVFPRAPRVELGNYTADGTAVFVTPDASFQSEIRRPQQLLGFPGIVE